MTLTMKIAEARQKLTQLPRQFERKHELGAVEVTSRGKPVLALMPWDLYESLIETLDIMGDNYLMKILRKSIKESQEGKTIPWERVKAKLKL